MPSYSIRPTQFETPPVYVPGLSNPIAIGPTPPAGTPQAQTGFPTTPVEVAVTTWAFAPGTPVVVSYHEAGAITESEVEGHPLPPIEIFLGQNAAGPAVPGSVRFIFRGRTYVDRAGSLVYNVDPTTNVGTPGGSFDYANCRALVTAYASGSNTVTVVSLLTRYVEPGITGAFFRAPGSPLVAGQFTIRATTLEGDLLIGEADINGVITGDSMTGEVDWIAGMARIDFGEFVTAAGNEAEPWYDPDLIDSGGNIWRPLSVDPATVFFGVVVARRIPVNPDIVGIDPVRLPSDGRVLGFNVGDVAMLSHTQTTSLTPAAGATTDLGRTQLAFVEIFDSAGVPIEDVWYAIDLAAGTVTWEDPLNLSGYTMPVIIRDRIQHRSQIADLTITGEITLAVPVPRTFPEGSVLSCLLELGDMQARVSTVFDQQTWGSPGVWQDVVNGSTAAANYNTLDHPIEVENDSCTDDRWSAVFQSSTSVLILSEFREALGPFSITEDIAPINPVSGKPFWTIRADGWGSGWAAGNALRWNTVSATRPLWAARVTLPGEITEAEDRVRVNAYGNAN
ncbi:MAG TPA: hypothetical protein PLZ93_15010 [Nocardioides sp.]|nr:hypothetical protein [Nocardioides sp.]